MQIHDNQWHAPFLALDLMGGTIKLIECDGEDMLTVTWVDGMQIDVGYVEEDGLYYITTLNDSTALSWQRPPSMIEVANRADLPQVLQAEIHRCRTPVRILPPVDSDAGSKPPFIKGIRKILYVVCFVLLIICTLSGALYDFLLPMRRIFPEWLRDFFFYTHFPMLIILILPIVLDRKKRK